MRPVCGGYTPGCYLDAGNRQHQEGACGFRQDDGDRDDSDHGDHGNNVHHDASPNDDIHHDDIHHGDIHDDIHHGDIYDDIHHGDGAGDVVAGREFETPEFASGDDGGFDGCDEAFLIGLNDWFWALCLLSNGELEVAYDEQKNEQLKAADRRSFLEQCGRFAMVTPPVVTMMLATDSTKKALAASGTSVTMSTKTALSTSTAVMLQPQDTGPRKSDVAMMVDSMGVMKPS